MREAEGRRVGKSSATRREFVASVALASGAIALAAGSAALAPAAVLAQGDAGISRTAEAIHQERTFKASRERVYRALTETAEFDKVVKLSAAMAQGGMAPGSKPTMVSGQAGGAFSAFGGYVTGRQIELVPNERIVQVWRAGSWKPGEFSLAKFVLVEDGANTKLVFDHTGFPAGTAEHLAEGWRVNYWEPLEKFLAQS